MPPATIALVVMNLAIALIDSMNDAALERLLWARGIDIHYGQWWRLAGCTVVHASWMHVAFNCYGIYVLGRLLEGLQGWRAVVGVYVISALGGAALGVAFNDPQTPMVGASGAAYGLMGAVLGFFYVKTGSVAGIWQVPASRQLAIWFLVGVGVSLAPGISLLGHAGGFVPGVLLGVYLELRYTRRADLYHHLSAGVMCLLVVGFCAYAVYPFRSGNLYAARALAAYERGNLDTGDSLVKQARTRGTSGGGDSLVTHLELWRKYSALNPREFNDSVLRWPLTAVRRQDMAGSGPWRFLRQDMIRDDHFEPDDTPRE